MKTKIIELKHGARAKPVKLLSYNRTVNNSLVNKLKASMDKYGILSAVTVYDAGAEYLLVDGQHRWKAASELGLTMPAISIGWDAMDAIVEMNTIQVNWTMANFVDFFSAHENPKIKAAYSLLKAKKSKYPKLTYSSLAKIYGKPFGGEAFKQGKWKVTDEKMGDNFVGYLDELNEFLPYSHSARFIYAYTDVAYHENYNHVRMMNKLNSNHSVSVLTSSNPGTYGRMLTRIYNFHQSKNLVMFKAAWV